MGRRGLMVPFWKKQTDNPKPYAHHRAHTPADVLPSSRIHTETARTAASSPICPLHLKRGRCPGNPVSVGSPHRPPKLARRTIANNTRAERRGMGRMQIRGGRQGHIQSPYDPSRGTLPKMVFRRATRPRGVLAVHRSNGRPDMCQYKLKIYSCGDSYIVRTPQTCSTYQRCCSFEVVEQTRDAVDCFACRRNPKRRMLPASKRGIYAAR